MSDSATVDDLLRFLSIEYGERFSNYLYHEKTEVHGCLQILVNGKSITTLKDLETELKDGDTLAVIPPMGGG